MDTIDSYTFLEGQAPEAIIDWAVQQFGSRLAMSSSFQMQSLPLLHIVSRVAPKLPIIFLDTGFHFPETLAFRDHVAKEWGLNLLVVHSEMGHSSFVQSYGHDLYRRDPDSCCYINKVEPMRRAMQGYKGWISGIRRDQTEARKRIKVVETADQELVRIHPMANWSDKDIWTYVSNQDLPPHPLFAKGYRSIGCAPCTRALSHNESVRDGRWSGNAKTECGLHTIMRTESIELVRADEELS